MPFVYTNVFSVSFVSILAYANSHVKTFCECFFNFIRIKRGCFFRYRRYLKLSMYLEMLKIVDIPNLTVKICKRTHKFFILTTGILF